jgi:hypothetical protein
MLRLRLLCWVVACVGCAGGAAGTGKPLHSFPSRSELAEIAAAPAAQAPIGADLIAVPSWKLDLASTGTQRPEAELLTALTPNAQVTPAFACVAHELARIVITKPNKRPDLSVRGFIAARCGALLAIPAFQTWNAHAAASVSDEAIVAQLRPQLSHALDASASQAGAALARNGEDVLLLVAFGSPQVAAEPFSQVVDAGGVLEIHGRVLFESDRLQAYINQRKFGFAPCELDPGVAPPAFSMRCTLAEGDDFAWVELLAAPRGHVLGQGVLDVLALRRADAASEYAPRTLGEARPVSDPAQFEAAVLEMVNAIRTRGGESALVSSGPQSRTANSVTPAFFSAWLSSRSTAQPAIDRITLGLLAGWEVSGGMIRSGELTASLIVDSLDAERWVADALERPFGRAVLLDPDARVLALGAAVNKGPDAVGALAVTYAFFEEESKPGERAMQVLERLARVREARGLGRTALIRDAPGVTEQLARVRHGQASPNDALHSLMVSLSQSIGRPVSGVLWETQDLDAIEFPSELLQQGDLALGAGVTFYRAPGGAWGQYVVLFTVVHAAAPVKV